MSSESSNIIPIAIEDSMRSAFIDYSMSVIVGRALPDVRDGMKPVHRRILFAMNEMGLLHNKPYRKSARLVGEVLGKYHPHGDSSVYDAMVRMAQTFSLRYPLVDGQGNFGSVDGDPPAAMRYTEARMKALAAEMMVDIEKQTVPFKTNFDESLEEPEVLPARIPNLLLNGSSGIAVGMATNIPPHNLRELAGGIQALIDNPELSVDELFPYVSGPDFPGGGIICGRSGIIKAYRTGHGSVTVRARAEIEPMKDGTRERIRISEIPYQVNKASLLQHIAHLVNNKDITGISDLRDESDKDGMRVIIELKRGEIGQVVLNRLYKMTSLQTSFNCNMLAIKDGRPKVMNLKEILISWIDHRFDVITKATLFDLAKAERRAHILEGFKIALANIDRVIETIKNASDRNSAHQKLMSDFELSELQATAILEMRLYQITAMEAGKIDKEYQELQEKIAYFKSLLADKGKIYALIRDDIGVMADKYGDDRRSSIEESNLDLMDEDLIADEPCIITVSHKGYIKRVPTNTYKTQGRGGRGVAGMGTRDEDYVEHLYSAMTHDTMMIFTDSGQLHWLKAYMIPETSRTARGMAIANLISISPEDKIASILTVREFDEERSVVMATRNGIVKKTSLALYSNVRKKGIIAINIRENDSLMSAALVHENDDIMLTTKEGYTVRFSETLISRMGRTASGVKGITLRGDDRLVGMQVVKEGSDEILLIVCENGYGKRTSVSEFRKTGRGGKGIITIKTSDRNGPIVSAMVVKEDEDIMLISAGGIMVRTAVWGISVQGRNTQGVRIVNLKNGDKLNSITTVEKEDEEE